jgi:sporulation protein YlmC with PRC-barrel domain
MKSASIVTITSFVLALLLAAPATADEQQTQAQSPAQKPQLEIEKSGSVRPSGSGSVTGHESGRVGTGQAQPVGEVAPERTTAAPVEDITGMNVVNTAGDEIGEVDEIVRDKETGKLSAVISVGGFLGIGDKDVAIPLDELQLQGEQLLAPLAGTEEQLKSRPAYEEARYEELPEEQIVQLGPKQGEASGSAMGKGSAAQTLFSALDANSDGYLSKQEASESAVVSEHWNRIDKDQNDRIDQAEFAAFEEVGVGKLPAPGDKPVESVPGGQPQNIEPPDQSGGGSGSGSY